MSGNVADQNTQTVAEPYKKATFEEFITYSALGGLITDELGRVTPLRLEEFCEAHNITERQTQRWKKMPDFGMRVRERRYEIWPVARETMLFNELVIVAKTSKDHKAKVDAIKTLLGHFSDLHLPTQKSEVKVEGNFLDMLTAAATEGIIEGEIVDADPEPQADAGGSIQDTGTLPPAS